MLKSFSLFPKGFGDIYVLLLGNTVTYLTSRDHFFCSLSTEISEQKNLEERSKGFGPESDI